jgi:hypothetical protein
MEPVYWLAASGPERALGAALYPTGMHLDLGLGPLRESGRALSKRLDRAALAPPPPLVVDLPAVEKCLVSPRPARRSCRRRSTSTSSAGFCRPFSPPETDTPNGGQGVVLRSRSAAQVLVVYLGDEDTTVASPVARQRASTAGFRRGPRAGWYPGTSARCDHDRGVLCGAPRYVKSATLCAPRGLRSVLGRPRPCRRKPGPAG